MDSHPGATWAQDTHLGALQTYRITEEIEANLGAMEDDSWAIEALSWATNVHSKATQAHLWAVEIQPDADEARPWVAAALSEPTVAVGAEEVHVTSVEAPSGAEEAQAELRSRGGQS